MTTVAATVAAALAATTDHVFALLGNGNAYVLDALARSRTPVTCVRHEAATVASADAYHRVSGRLAAATTTYGAGLTNAVTALTEAALAGTPLLLLAGDAPAQGRRSFDIDQGELVHATGARFVHLDAAAPGTLVAEAAWDAVTHRRPVVLALPYDTATAQAADPGVPAPHPPTAPREAGADELDAVAAQLVQAARPLVVAGRGARGCGAEVRALAERLGALTATTAPARGLLAGYPGDVGICGGFAGDEAAGLIQGADVVLVLGAGLNPFTAREGRAFAPDAAVIQVDLRPAATHPLVTRFVRADVGATVRGLRARLDAGGAWEPRPGAAPRVRSGVRYLRSHDGAEVAADGRLDPRAVFTRLERILPAERQVVSDGGHFIGWANTYLSLPREDSIVLVGTAFQSIGLGLPSAPGALVARPEVTTVVVVGDGGGIMGLADLETVTRCARSALVVVVNDGVYGAEVHQYGTLGLDQAAMRVGEIDFAALGRALGAQGAVIRTLGDLSVVEQWLSAGARGVLVADVRVSPDVVAPYLSGLVTPREQPAR